MQVRKLCTREVVTISPDASVLDAAQLMRAEHVGDVVAVDVNRHPVGILTDRDIVVGLVAKDVDHVGRVAVREVLTPDPIVAREDEDFESVLARMRRHGVSRIPVVDRDGVLVGIFAVDDALKTIAEDLTSLVGLVGAQHRREQGARRTSSHVVST